MAPPPPPAPTKLSVFALVYEDSKFLLTRLVEEEGSGGGGSDERGKEKIFYSTPRRTVEPRSTGPGASGRWMEP